MSYELRLDAVTVLSYAMAYNRVPVVNGLDIFVTPGGPANVEGELRLSLVDDQGPLSQEWVRAVTLPESGTVKVRGIDLALDGAQVSQLGERTPARYVCILTGDEGTELAQIALPVDVLAPRQWLASPPGLGLEMLAAHVMPNAPEVAQLMYYSSERLRRTTGSPSLEGYQSGPERVDAIVRAVYETLQAGGIGYAEPPPSWADDGQKIRTPADVLAGPEGRGGLATCLDSTLLMAAALEHAGIHPMVVLTSGHSFLAYWRTDASLAMVAQRDTNDLVNRVHLGQVGLLEITGICDGVDLPWEVACQRPHAELARPADEVLGVMDVFAARQNRIIPLPARARAADGQPIIVEYRSDVHSLAPEERDERTAVPPGTNEAMPARFLRWQNALIDLSLRNPLLNLSSRTGIRLAVPGDLGDRIDDRLAANKRLIVMPYDGLGALHEARTQPRSVLEVDEQVVRDLFTRQGAVVADVTSASYATTLRNLAYKARTIVEEVGANSLHLTLGELVWELDGRELRAPLVLIPVHLRAVAGERRYEIVADEAGQPTPNFCLAEKLRQSHQVSIDALENAPTDAHGLDVNALFTAVRVALAKESLPFRVEMASRLAVVQFAKFRLWRDIADHWSEMLASPLVRHLALTPTHDFVDPVSASAERVDLDALGARCPIPADASQVEAIGAALQGRTFVLEGPPGTGKSQTITNLLARAVADGQRVLFVAEKQAALEVVKRRLDDVGLASISLDLHDKSAKPAEIRRQIQQALDLVADSDDEVLVRTRDEQQARRRPLARYVEAVHSVNGAGLSLYGAVAMRGAVQVPVMPVPESAVVPEASARIAEVRSAVRLLPDVADPVGPAPSPWGFATRVPGDVDAAAVYGASAVYEEGVADASPERVGLWSTALATCRTPGELAAVGRLLALRDVRVETVSLICSQSWDQLLARVSDEVRSFAAAGWGLALPAALDLDLDRLLLEAKAAEDSFFLFRGGRLRKVTAEFRDVLVPGAQLDAKQVVAFITSLLAIRDRGHALAATIVDRLPNLDLPAQWQPWRPEALSALSEAAAAVRRRAAAADPSVARDELVSAVRSALPLRDDVAPEVRGAIIAVGDAVSALAHLLDINENDAARWSGADGFGATWQATASRRALRDSGHSSLCAWQSLLAQIEPLREAGLDRAAQDVLDGRLDPDLAPLSLEAGLGEASRAERLARGQLATFQVDVHERAIERYRASAAELRGAERDGLLDTTLRRRTFAATSQIGQVGALRRDLAKKRGGKSVRALLATYAELIAEIMPCALVSPDSVARFYPVKPGLFDLVVFDEASQIKVADAIGAIARGGAVVVVGDSKQMPPSSFAEVVAATDEESGWLAASVEDEESILSECVQAGLPRQWLSWHYRSQDESLIAFSNAHYYEGRLSSFPAPVRGAASPGLDGHGICLVRVAGQFLRDGSGRDLRTNPIEAEAIVAAIRERFDAAPQGTMPSIGVVTFNVQQRGLIESLLRDSDDRRLAQALDSGHEGLFVKNLENVQGDERDVIMFSTAFSVNERGVLPLNFGPLNLSGGERRLNVAITRARRQVLVYSSFDPEQLRAEETTSVGVKHLRAYLELAAAGSPLNAVATLRRPVRDRHRDEVATRLRSAGLAVSVDVGLSEFRVDLCLARPEEPDVPLVAVLLDSVAWGARRTVADQYELPTVVLSGMLRWPRLEWVWTPEWLANPDQVVRRLVDAVETASKPAVMPAWEPFPAEDGEAGPASDEEPSDPSAASDQADAVDQVDPADAASVVAAAATLDLRVDPGPDAERRSGRGVGTDGGASSASPSLLPGESLWTPWQPRTLGKRAVLDALPGADAVARVGTALREVVEHEGPVHRDRATKLVAAAFGLERLSAARAAAIAATGPYGEGDWLWPEGLDPLTWREFRRSTGDASRPLDQVADEEIINALVATAGGSRGVGKDELIGATLAVFGMSRRGARVSERVSQLIERALRLDRLARRNGLYQLP